MIDTNVLAHCYNPIEARCECALELVSRVLTGTQMLCVDEGFDIDEARNRSVIGAEYRAHVRFGSPGFAMVVALALTGRIRVTPARPPTREYKLLRQMVRDRGDRVFVGVAWHSTDRLLVSHDLTDFDEATRKRIRQEVGVDIIEADECGGRM